MRQSFLFLSILLTPLALTACGDDGNSADAAVASIDATQPDAGGPDASSADLCAEPGAVGNSKGVGKYCTAGGGECSGNGSATICSVDFQADVPPICTMPCADSSACGEDATCEGEGLEKGCAPACLVSL